MSVGALGMGAGCFGAMLEGTAREASEEVQSAVEKLEQLLEEDSRTRPQLAQAIQLAARQLGRTYLALADEARAIAEVTPGSRPSLARLSRARLVQRIHRGGGDFELIARVCRGLQPLAERDPAAAAALEVLYSWTDREAHLFGMLVPLATLADQLARVLLSPAEDDPPWLAGALVRETRRTVAAALRRLEASAAALMRLGDAAVPRSSHVPGAASFRRGEGDTARRAGSTG